MFLNLYHYIYLFVKCKDCCWEFESDSYSHSILFTVLWVMYLYAFDEYVGNDRIFSAPGIVLPIGTLFVSQGRKYLVLWETVAFSETYKHTFRGHPDEVLGLLLSDKEITLIHYMANTYFALYKNIVSLFVDDPLAVFVWSKIKKIPSSSHFLLDGHSLSTHVSVGQQLVVFPDLWTLTSTLSAFGDMDCSTWHHGLTHKQQTRLFDAIAQGSSTVLCCTHGGIFRRWADLCSIVLVEPNAWYYHNYQEPRYSVPDLLIKMSEIYGATIDFLRY